MNLSVQKKFGRQIKQKRLNLSWSQEKLAEKSELHRTYISSVELGERNISLVNIEKLAVALNCDISSLFSKE
jgi:transcriptional regulator with XRE-family HTH domain